MKRVFKIALAILLTISIVLCIGWYLFIYDRDFTRDMLLTCARYFENEGNHSVSTWLYNTAYNHANDADSVAIELAQQYKDNGNYTKAEFILTKAISDGCGVDVYIALCKTFLEQNKVLDAVNMLDSIASPEIKAQLDARRPKVPAVSHEPSFYNDFISVAVTSDNAGLYVTVDGSYPSIPHSLYFEPVTLSLGENKLLAVAVSEEGLVSPLAEYDYIVGGIIEQVHFSDAAMEKEIRSLLNVAEDTVLYTNDLWSITAFTVPADANVYSDLTLMPYIKELTIHDGIAEQLVHITSLENLTSLIITDTPVSQDLLSAIVKFPLLKELTLNGCSLTSITALEAARGLVRLDLSNNTLRNISAISLMQNLEELYLSHNVLNEVSALTVLRNLHTLDISYNTIANITPIASAQNLTYLNAEHNLITDITALGSLSQLSHLVLTHNQITDVSALAECTNMTQLFIGNNQITDIGSLVALSNLMFLHFPNNQVTTLPGWSIFSPLVTIDGSYNQITSLEPLRGLQNLNNVYMDYNEGITKVDMLADCPVMIYVNIFGTKVKDVTALTAENIIVNWNPTYGQN